jgi:hypothetical protein
MLLLQEGLGDGSDHESSSHSRGYRSFSVRLLLVHVKDRGQWTRAE